MKEITKRRLGLLAQGYRIIPTHGKAARLKGWPTQEFVDRELNEKRVTSWERRFPDLKSIGVRLDLGLGSIDADADNPELSEAAWQAIEAKAPLIAAHAPVRYGKGPNKFALFVRVEGEPFKYAVSRYYLRPEALAAWQAAVAAAGLEKVPDPETHKIEIFGGAAGRNGNCVRHFGIVGPHSYAEDGSVAAEYRWGEGATLEDTPLAGLPVLTEELATDIINDFDARAAALGWVPLGEAAAGGNSQVAYDITAATRFDTDKGGEQIDYDELCAEFGMYGSLRCSANFIPGRGAGGGRDHCAVGDRNRHGCVAVHVYGDDCTHFPAALAPQPDLIADEIERLREELGPGLAAPRQDRTRPTDSMSVARKTIWLVDNYGYCAQSDSVVELYTRHAACLLKPLAFGRLYRSWREEVVGPRGGRTWSYATGRWEVDPQRVDVEGVRMRPDRPFPLYTEGGKTYKNTYQAPVHETNGTLNVATLTGPFVAFMERFIPDPDERGWLLDWMAHKQAHPEIPGTAVIYVADTEDDTREGKFGTGRGMLFKVAHLLYGEQYARSQSFAILEGSSGQSAFNDWMHGSILVTVDEAKTSPTAHRRGEKSATYEVLKELVDPAPKRHTFNGKYRQAFDGMSYCSFWVASNHADALSIPENDRRFTVLRNGRPITDEEAVAFAEWTEMPGAIAALSELLAARDLTRFNMFQPLVTVGKAEMAELARSDVEEMLRDILDDDSRGLVFTKQHIEDVLASNYSGQGPYWRGEFKGVWQKYCVGLKTPAGGPRRVKMLGTQKKLFCFRARHARVRALPYAAVQREAAKWGHVDPVEGLAEAVGLGE